MYAADEAKLECFCELDWCAWRRRKAQGRKGLSYSLILILSALTTNTQLNTPIEEESQGYQYAANAVCLNST